MKKINSGRFILTVISGLVFGYATYAKILPSEAVVSVISMVFVSYFNKRDHDK